MLERIVYPGHWDCLAAQPGSQRDAGAGLRLELKEEINGEIRRLPLWFSHHDSQRKRPNFFARPAGPIEAAGAAGGSWTWCSLSPQRVASGRILPPRLDQHVPWPSLREGHARNGAEQSGLASAGNVRPWLLASGEDCSRFVVDATAQLIHLRNYNKAE